MADAKGARKAILCFLAAVAGIMGVAAFVAAFQFWLFLKLPGSAGRGVQVLEIRQGMSAAAIAQRLHEAGVVADARKFYFLCWLRQSGHKLKAGEYAFLPLSTPDQILDQLTSGRVVLHRLTLPEGSTLRDVAQILAQKGVASKEAVLRLATDADYIKGLGLEDVPSLEGYLFPETYFFSRAEDLHSILKTMVRQFRVNFPEALQKQAGELGLTAHEVVILASMVEKEAVVESERPLIAAVFFNRLKRNMPLQSDPTAVYDMADFSGPITWSHLKRESPYNTYRNRGLPAGPICNPGAGSLKAVLNPERVPYLYFVSNNDGTHQFSETWAEHLRAVSRYREKLRNLGRDQAKE